MGKLVEVSRSDELAEGAMREIVAKGHKILLARAGDTYYAVDNRCPHLGGRLSEGTLEGFIVTCPRHGSQFDLRDGKVVRWLKGSRLISMIGKSLKSPKPITIYEVKVEDDRILIEVFTAEV